jgi:mono/diheme cytochrome c family protein
MRSTIGWAVFAAVGLVLAFTAAPRAVAGDPPVDFNREIRPILSENCYACHGPDAAKRDADLRLDTRQGLFAPRPGDPTLVPGDPDSSALVYRTEEQDETVHMPPPASGKSLSPAQVALIRRWVEEGARWKGHWAYERPERLRVPARPADSPRRSALDAFIADELTERSIPASAQADPETLFRRLTLDLSGLPPDPADLVAFLSDPRPDAYERAVDRLLGSPHHGERLASYWLDLVRYADTVGYHGDNHQEVWLYRDWVIDAFNQNMPFDRFTLEQLAGDLLPGATQGQRIASGYNRILMTTREGGAQPKEYLAKYAADRVRDVSGVWMGATLGCAECHDHKYDPYTTEDFYRFAAFFADLEETAVGEQTSTRMPRPDQVSELARLEALRVGVEKQIEAWTPELQTGLRAWEQRRREAAAIWKPLELLSAKSEQGTDLQVSPDGSIHARGVSPAKDTYVLEMKSALSRATAMRLEALPDPSLPARGPGRADNGNAVIAELRIEINVHPAVVARASDSHHQRGFPAEHAIDGKPATGWAVLPRAGRASEAWFVFESPIELRADDTWKLTIDMPHGDRHTLGRFRLSVTDSITDQNPQPALSEEIERVLSVGDGARTPEQQETLSRYFRTIAPELAPARAAQSALHAQQRRIEAEVPTTLISRSMPEPRVMRILPRGNWLDESGEVVTPATPAFLPRLDAASDRGSRLDLARWMVAKENPLVARVLVNRLWMLFFGQGLVPTEDDLGSQGASPSHPALLDWLALEFQESGWDIHHIIRLIVTSHVYRQSSHASPSQVAIDPENRWLGRQGRVRLDAEMVRDQALAASGLLARTIGGPSARPYQPPGYWSYLNFPPREYEVDTGDGLYRRGLYSYWCRTFLHPSLLAFDAPTREECTVQRPRSNTPLQALVLLNDPTYAEAARVLAERVMRESSEDIEARIERGYQHVLGRHARTDEMSVLRALYQKHESAYQTDYASAHDVISAGAWPVADDLDSVDLAATTSLMRVILNLHEAITRY